MMLDSNILMGFENLLNMGGNDKKIRGKIHVGQTYLDFLRVCYLIG